MNSYNIYDENESNTILFHAIASDESEVAELAEIEGYDIEGLTIDLIRANVKTQTGKNPDASINVAII